MRLDRTKRGFIISAVDLGSLFGIPADEVRRMMQDQSIVTRVEKGEGDDQGRFRLSFLGPECRVQLIVDEAGHVLRRTRASRHRVRAGDVPVRT